MAHHSAKPTPPPPAATQTLGLIEQLLKCLPSQAQAAEIQKHDWSRPGTIGDRKALEAALAQVAQQLSLASGLAQANLTKLLAAIELPDPTAADPGKGRSRTPIPAALPAALRGANGSPPPASAAPNVDDPKLIDELRAIVKEADGCGAAKLLEQLAKEVAADKAGTWPEEMLARLDVTQLVQLLERLSPILNSGWAPSKSAGQPVDAAHAVAGIQRFARQLQERMAALGA